MKNTDRKDQYMEIKKIKNELAREICIDLGSSFRQPASVRPLYLTPSIDCPRKGRGDQMQKGMR